MKRIPADISYLVSRDPSIVCRDGRPMPRRKNLTFGEDLTEEDLTPNVKVFLRVKPQDAVEIGPEVPSFKIIGSNSLSTTSWIRGKQVVQQFSFTSILPVRASQQLVFDSVARRPLQDLLSAQRSGLVFTYGTTNAGKTHTMFGNDQDPGLIPLSLAALFSSLNNVLLPGPQLKPTDAGVVQIDADSQLRETALRNKLLDWNPKFGEDTYSVSMMSGSHKATDCTSLPQMSLHANLQPGQCANIWVSCVEIYQEQAFDLLSSSQTTALPLRGDNVRGLTVVCVDTADEAQRILLLARHRLHSAETGLNLRSSRSHCVFTVRIALSTPSKPNSQMQFDFVDLAGSERADKTNNRGLRLIESAKINQSLSVLGRCLKAMRANQKGGSEIVPFRDSLLTRLLKTQLLSLCGENVSLLVCASAESKTFPETCKALQFASIARRVQLRLPPRSSQAAPSRFSILAVARPSTGWLAPAPRAPKGQGDSCPGCRRAENDAQARLAEQETRLRRELVDQFSEMLKGVEDMHRQELKHQETRLMELVKHREAHMLATMAAQEETMTKRNRGKRARTDVSDQSDSDDSEDEVEVLDQVVADEIAQLRDEVSAAAKAVADAEFRAAHAELRIREMASPQLDAEAPEKYESKIEELSALLEEARIDHLQDRNEIERLRQELCRANEDLALKEIELDDTQANMEELRACLNEKSTLHTSYIENAQRELREKISEFESLTTKLSSEISAAESLRTELQTKVSELEMSESQLKAKLPALEAEVAKLTETVAQRDAELVALRQRVRNEDDKEANMELEVKQLLQSQRTLTSELDSANENARTTMAALARAEAQLNSLGKENEALVRLMEVQKREEEERAIRAGAQFSQLEELLRKEREALSLAKRDSAAATAQLYRLTPARRQRSHSASNVDDSKENSACGANLAPPERPLTRSSRRVESMTSTASSTTRESKKVTRKLFVQRESLMSPELSPESKPVTRSRRK